MPSRSWKTSTWPSVSGPAPMPMTGTCIRGMSSDATALGMASNTIAKQPAPWRASASRAMRSAACAVRPCARYPPRAVEVCGVRPTWPITGMPASTIAFAPATRGAGEDEQLVELHGHGARVAEHGHRARVADQDEVDAGVLGRAGAGEV